MLFNLQLTGPALMICAAISVSYVNKVGNDVDDNGRLVIEDEDTDHKYEYNNYESAGEFDTAGSRAAAGWTLFVSCACLFYNVSVFSILKYYLKFDMEKHNTVYSVIVSQCITMYICM